MPLPRFFTPTETPKGWGKEVLLASTPEYTGKLLVFNRGAQFSTHFHALKHETFFILSGRIRFTFIDTKDASTRSMILDAGACIEIPRLSPHRIEAIEDTTIIEVSTHHEDSDSYRVVPGDSQHERPPLFTPS